MHQSPGSAIHKAPSGSRVYAIGDIHGRSDLLRRLHAMILADAAPGSPDSPDSGALRKVVVYVGDYVDRGPDGAGVIDILINQPLEGFESHPLKGNHEDMMIRFLESGEGGDMWLFNGGRDTLQSYGIEFSDMSLYLSEPEALAPVFRDAVPPSHRAFLNGLAIHHREGDYLFVHAGMRPGVALEDQSEQDLIWIRDEFTGSDADFGAIVVHGHSIRAEPEIRPNRIGIDTGAWRSNRLTALVLEGDTRRFLQT